MSRNNHTILAVVPARGGSKGIPRKNLRTIAGKSLIEHVANAVSELPYIDQVILSTDNEEISFEGKRVGLKVPFLRPLNLSGDKAKSIDVWRHTWLASEEYFKTRFDISILLEPTSPLRKSDDITACIDLLIEKNADCIVTVSRNPGHFTPEKTLCINKSGQLAPYLEDGLRYTLRQEIPPYYHRNGVCYAVTRKHLIENNRLMDGYCQPLVITRPVVNIDDELDIAWAEFLLNKKDR